MSVPTGIPVLDDMVDGGIPDQRAILLLGGPGTGKTTLAMQYLQEGIDRDEDCLFVSTEQTPDELRQSFAPFDFDLDHDQLAIKTIHATTGSTIEEGDEQLVIDSLTGAHGSEGSQESEPAPLIEGGQTMRFGPYSREFSGRNLQEVIAEFGPCDRVVFDSVSGLEVMAENQHVFRRSVLDFIRLFSDRFGATTLLTAEETERSRGGPNGSAGMLQFNTHGVIRLWREQVEGHYHRFIRVEKMRGVDHDTHAFELEFSRRGVHVGPESRTQGSVFIGHDSLTTGINGLDQLCGGGLIEGGTALLNHDGRANVIMMVANTIIESIRDENAVVLLPPASLEPAHLEKFLVERVGGISELLADDRLFVLDLGGAWEAFDENVFGIRDYERTIRGIFGGLQMLVSWKMKRIFSQMNDRRGDRPALAVVFTDSMLQEFSPVEVRQMHQWAKKNLFVPEDTVLFVQNPGVMDRSLAEFFVLDAQQLLRTWIHDNGLQYIKLEKSPTGRLGNSMLVEHVDYPPYVRVQRSDSDGQRGDSP